MKKFLYIASAALALLISGCNEKKSDTKSEVTQTRNIVFESYSYDQIGTYQSGDSIAAPGGK